MTRVPIIVPKAGQELTFTITSQPVISQEHYRVADKKFQLCYAMALLADCELGPCPLCPDTDRRCKAYIPGVLWVRGEPQPTIVNVPESSWLPWEGVKLSADGVTVKILRGSQSGSGVRIWKFHTQATSSQFPVTRPDVRRVLRNVWGIYDLLEAKLKNQKRKANEIIAENMQYAESRGDQGKGNRSGKKGSPSQRK